MKMACGMSCLADVAWSGMSQYVVCEREGVAGMTPPWS